MSLAGIEKDRISVEDYLAGDDAFYYPDLVLTCDADDRAGPRARQHLRGR
jgi:hypothetical protein